MLSVFAALELFVLPVRMLFCRKLQCSFLLDHREGISYLWFGQLFCCCLHEFFLHLHSPCWAGLPKYHPRQASCASDLSVNDCPPYSGGHISIFALSFSSLHSYSALTWNDLISAPVKTFQLCCFPRVFVMLSMSLPLCKNLPFFFSCWWHGASLFFKLPHNLFAMC